MRPDGFLPLLSAVGSKTLTSPVPSVKSTVFAAWRTTWPGLAPLYSMSVRAWSVASRTRNPLSVETMTWSLSPAGLTRLKPGRSMVLASFRLSPSRMYRPPSKVATSGSLTATAGVASTVLSDSVSAEEALSPPQAVRTVAVARASTVPVRALPRIDLFIGLFLSAPLGGGMGYDEQAPDGRVCREDREARIW